MTELTGSVGCRANQCGPGTNQVSGNICILYYSRNVFCPERQREGEREGGREGETEGEKERGRGTRGRDGKREGGTEVLSSANDHTNI